MAPPKRRKRSCLARQAFTFSVPDDFLPPQTRAIATEEELDIARGRAPEALDGAHGAPGATPASVMAQEDAELTCQTHDSDSSTDDTICAPNMDDQRQYDLMRKVESPFSTAQAWPSRSRLT